MRQPEREREMERERERETVLEGGKQADPDRQADRHRPLKAHVGSDRNAESELGRRTSCRITSFPPQMSEMRGQLSMACVRFPFFQHIFRQTRGRGVWDAFQDVESGRARGCGRPRGLGTRAAPSFRGPWESPGPPAWPRSVGGHRGFRFVLEHR